MFATSIKFVYAFKTVNKKTQKPQTSQGLEGMARCSRGGGKLENEETNLQLP
jgi:hypothetical protein